MLVNLNDYVSAINQAVDIAIQKSLEEMKEDSNADTVKKYSDLIGANTWFNLLINNENKAQ